MALWDFMSSGRASLRSQRTSSALTPMLILAAIVVPACALGAAKATDPTIQWFFLVVLAVTIVAVLGAYFYLLIKDPKRLHSETHIFQMKALDIIQKGGGPLAGKLLEAGFNPFVDDIQPGEEKKVSVVVSKDKKKDKKEGD